MMLEDALVSGYRVKTRKRTPDVGTCLPKGEQKTLSEVQELNFDFDVARR